MPIRCTVAEARNSLPKLLHEVQEGRQLEITRRGEPVAVVLSMADYRRLTGQHDGFSKAYENWSASVAPEDLALPERYFDQLRDPSPGREVDL